MIFDNRPCELGEGPLWHPQRGQLFWFDITGQRMLSVEKGEQRQWRFPEMVSAAGWVDRDMLLIAGERDLFLFDVETEEIQTLVDPDQQDPSLPPGHPFRNIRSGIYWTATAHPKDDIVAWQQSFFSGQAVTDQKSGTRRLWCVLGQAGK